MIVGVANFVLTHAILRAYGATHEITLGGQPIVTKIAGVAAIWAVEGALLLGILTVFVFAWRPVLAKFADGSKAAVAGALLASLNTASEYGFGGVIALLPGFVLIADALKAIPNPLINEAISVTVLAGITGSASGGMSIALAAMSDHVHCRRRGGQDSARGAASRRLDGERRHGHAAAQRRRHHAAGRDRPHAQAGLQGHLRDHADQDRGGVRRHRRLLSDRHLY